MITTVNIKTKEDLENLVFDLEKNSDNGRHRTSCIYRGMCDSSYDLSTSLMRNCGKKSKNLERHLLENFIKYVSIEDPTISESIWKAMIVGQHHGLPTRLLDWSHSILVALHFATTEGSMDELDKRDCVVWKIDVKEINERLPEKYKKVLYEKESFIFSLKDLNNLVKTINEYDVDMGDNSLVSIEPPSLDQRIANQYSFFTILPSGITDLKDYLDKTTKKTVKYVIDKSLVWYLRDSLDQWNINERMIYPGKDGISKWLARHYFVKKEDR